MQLKFQVAAELVKLAAVSQHVLFKNKIRKKGGGEIFPSAGVYLCLLQSLWCSAESPGIQQGAVGCRELPAECGWQLLGLCCPLGFWCGPSKPQPRCCHAKPQLWQQSGPYPAPPSWRWGMWAAALGGFGPSLGDGDKAMGRCRDTARHSPAESVVLGWLKNVPARTDLVLSKVNVRLN